MRFAWVPLVAHLLLATTGNAQLLAAPADSAMRAAEQAGFSGVVRLEKAGSVVLEKGYGLAVRKPSTRFTPATVVQIGSNTKDFTAVAILQLQERGRLNIKDSLGKFFPGAPADKRGITLFQLMKHRAGFPLGLGRDFEPVGREQLIKNAMKFRLLSKPGERENYSNTGYSILAAIIEQVSGGTYDSYVQENILSPLGLRHTGFLLPGFKMNQLAHGYTQNGDDAGTMLSKPHAADGPYWNLRGNGGMLSTVSDMHTFYNALFEGDKLLSPRTRDIMFHADEPVGLAGSDRVNFFLYERDPVAHTEMIIASNDAKHRAPLVRQSLARVFGLPTAVGNEKGGEGGAQVHPIGKAPAREVSAVISGLVAAINSGDNKRLLDFITAHFESGPSAPKPEERVARVGGVHQNLGDITVNRMYDSGDGPIQVAIQTHNEGAGTLIVDIDRIAPYKIKRVGVKIGGD